MHLNDLGRPMLKEHFGLNELFAKELLEAKGGENFKNINDLRTRMQNYYLTNGYEEDSDKLDKMDEWINIIQTKIKKSNNLLKI